MTKRIGKREVLSALARVVKKNDAKNKTYDDILGGLGLPPGVSCIYKTEDGRPACIVGQVVIGEFGIDVPAYAGAWTDSNVVLEGTAYERFTPAANEALRAAQRMQDGMWESDYVRSTWGEALKAAREA